MKRIYNDGMSSCRNNMTLLIWTMMIIHYSFGFMGMTSYNLQQQQQLSPFHVRKLVFHPSVSDSSLHQKKRRMIVMHQENHHHDNILNTTSSSSSSSILSNQYYDNNNESFWNTLQESIQMMESKPPSWKPTWYADILYASSQNVLTLDHTVMTTLYDYCERYREDWIPHVNPRRLIRQTFYASRNSHSTKLQHAILHYITTHTHTLADCTARDISHLLHHIATSSSYSTDKQLGSMKPILRRIHKLRHDLNPTDVTRTIWSLSQIIFHISNNDDDDKDVHAMRKLVYTLIQEYSSSQKEKRFSIPQLSDILSSCQYRIFNMTDPSYIHLLHDLAQSHLPSSSDTINYDDINPVQLIRLSTIVSKLPSIDEDDWRISLFKNHWNQYIINKFKDEECMTLELWIYWYLSNYRIIQQNSSMSLSKQQELKEELLNDIHTNLPIQDSTTLPIPTIAHWYHCYSDLLLASTSQNVDEEQVHNLKLSMFEWILSSTQQQQQQLTPKIACWIVHSCTKLYTEKEQEKKYIWQIFHNVLGDTLVLAQIHEVTYLNCCHLLYGMAKLSYPYDLGIFDHYALFFSQFLEQTERIPIRTVVQAIWACGKMSMWDDDNHKQTSSYQIHVPTMIKYITTNDDVLINATPKDIAQCIWALGRLQLPNSTSYLSTLLIHNKNNSDIPNQWNEQEIANVLWGCSKILVKPKNQTANSTDGIDTKHIIEYIEDTLLSHVVSLEGYTSQEVSNILYACGKLQIRHIPTIEYMNQMLLENCMPDITAQAMANTLWAYHQLQLDPDPKLLNTWAFEKLQLTTTTITNTTTITTKRG